MAETEVDEAKDTVEEGGQKLTGGNGNDNLKRLLIPAAAGVGTLAVTYAASKAPDLVREHLLPKVEQKGADEATKVGQQAAEGLKSGGGVMGKVAGKAAEKLSGGGSGSSGKTRRLPIQRWTDVAVPVDTAYGKWTEFEEFPKFMHRVLSVEAKDDNRISWQEKIWFSKRQWEGEIVEKRKNDRVAWKTVQGTAHAGIVSFHKLDDKLTRVMVTVDFKPSGMIEKMASGMRFVKRAVQADLARFKTYVEMGEVEGLEYGHDAGGGGDEGAEQPSSRSNGKPKSSSRSNGSDTRSDANSDESPEEQEEARRKRAERREQRRA
jgi:uncharacterized membrane protein